MKLLVTGGAGFIGSAVIRQALKEGKFESVLNFDKLTYAGDLESLKHFESDPRYHFVQGDICNEFEVDRAITSFQPDYIMHLAAESHVDRSIDGPKDFVQTNIIGTFQLLQSCLKYFRKLSHERKDTFRFHHVSTDEVYGSLGNSGLFTESTPYQPNSPYSASKASSDHLVRAWHHTFDLPVLITNCSNNYGSYQYPEKLIPLMILNALDGKDLPVYGRGDNIRDWLFVDDHARALLLVLTKGKVGEVYNIGGHNERTNLSVVETICDILDELAPLKNISNRKENLIKFVQDRPGHDHRYAIDASKIQSELGWTPSESFESGIRKTVEWYVEEQYQWCQHIKSKLSIPSRLGLSSENSNGNRSESL